MSLVMSAPAVGPLAPRTERALWLLTAITALRNSNFYIPVIFLFYSQVAGISFADYMLSEAIFAIAITVLEVPTGWISDVWKRRSVMILGMLCWTVAVAYMLFLTRTFIDLAITQIIMAFGASFISGTAQALVYEYLAEDGQDAAFKKYEGRRFAISFYALAAVALPAGLLFEISPYLPVALTLGTNALGLVLCFFLPEPARVKERAAHHPLVDALLTMKYALHGHKEIAAIVLLAAVMFSCTKLVLWIQQPYYTAAGLPVMWFGAMSTLAFVMVGVFSQLAHRLDQRLAPVMVLGGNLTFLVGAAWLAGGFVWIPFAFLLVLAQSSHGLTQAVVSDIVCRRAPAARRATILSTQSLMAQLVFAVIAVPYGSISAEWSVGAALLALGTWVFVAGGAAWLLLRLRLR